MISLRQQTRKMVSFVYLDESSVIRIFQHRIVTLSVDGNVTCENIPTREWRGNLLSRISIMFTSVLHLKFFQPINYSDRFVTFYSKTPKFCSNLVELHISLLTFDDCLHLLEGRLNQLRRLLVNVRFSWSIEPMNDNRVSYEQNEEIEVFFNERFISLRTN